MFASTRSLEEQNISDLLMKQVSIEFFQNHPFYLFQIPVDISQKDFTKRRKIVDIAIRTEAPIPEGAANYLQKSFTSDQDTLTKVSDKLDDPITRMLYEFFWFWPKSGKNCSEDIGLSLALSDGLAKSVPYWIAQTKSDPDDGSAVHNLAVFAQLLAFGTIENVDMSILGGARNENPSMIAFRCWRSVLGNDRFWYDFSARIKQLGDPRLTDGVIQSLRKLLPVFLINLHLEIVQKLLRDGKEALAAQTAKAIREGGFDKDAYEEAWEVYLKPSKSRLQSLKSRCSEMMDKNPSKNLILDYVKKTANEFSQIGIIVPRYSIHVQDIYDETADFLFVSVSQYVHDSDDLIDGLALLKNALDCSVNSSLKSRIQERYDEWEDIVQTMNLYRNQYYAEVSSEVFKFLENARSLLHEGKLDQAVTLLDNLLMKENGNVTAWNAIACSLAFVLNQRGFRHVKAAFDNMDFQTAVMKQVAIMHATRPRYVIASQNICHCCGSSVRGQHFYYFDNDDGPRTILCVSCNNSHDRETAQFRSTIENELRQAFKDFSLAIVLAPENTSAQENRRHATEILQKFGLTPQTPAVPSHYRSKRSGSSSSATNQPAKPGVPQAPAAAAVPATSKPAPAQPAVSTRMPVTTGDDAHRKERERKQANTTGIYWAIALIVGVILCVSLFNLPPSVNSSVYNPQNYDPKATDSRILNGSESINTAESIVWAETPTPTPTQTPITVTTDTIDAIDTPVPTAIIISQLKGCSTANLNIRSKPGTDQNIVGVIPSGKCFVVLGRSKDGKWLYVDEYEKKTGWVYVDFVKGDTGKFPIEALLVLQ